MERLLRDGAPRHVMVEAVQEARAAIPTQEAAVFAVDGEPRGGLSASSGGLTARCATVRETLVVAIVDTTATAIAVTLGPAGPASGLT